MAERSQSSWPHEEANPGEYLRRRFLEPLQITAAELARGTAMSRSRVSELLRGRRAITADTATRIAAYLGMDPAFWMALQASHDLASVRAVAEQVEPAETRGHLVGPRGARPLARTSTPASVRVRVPPDVLGRLQDKAAATPPTPAGEPVATEYASGTRAIVCRPRSPSGTGS